MNPFCAVGVCGRGGGLINAGEVGESDPPHAWTEAPNLRTGQGFENLVS